MKKNKFLPAIEQKSLPEIIKFQEKQLRAELQYLLQYSKYYKQLFSKNKINTAKIKTLADLKNIPVTTKDELQKHNKNFICVHSKDIIDYMTTSGTLGEPVTYTATHHDLERLAYNEAMSFACAGVKPDDVVQIMTTLDRRFMAGLAYFLGLRKMGAGIVRAGSGVPELHWDSIFRYKPKYMIVVPSFILKLIEFAEANNIDYRNTSLNSAVCIGEPLRNADFSLNTLGKRITAKWPLKLFSTYASTEMGSAFTECENSCGGHLHPELIITEFLDDNNNPVPEGEPGEITVTTLGVEGMPLLRFKTGDVCYHHSEPCACGRNTLRLGPVIGRKQQMIKYKGTTLYPPALYSILDDFDTIENYQVEVSSNKIGTDNILIYVGLKSNNPAFTEKLKSRFRARLRVIPEIKIMDPAKLNLMISPPTSRKAIKFIDRRMEL